ncbi:DUF1259 domain-containing protein [Marininema halotolerans]|uniref:Uncharacterized protein n=1 Tax=Marininema halotolerans TaxID=1155944 RepID=A0A1I6R9L7_9BACL|nr:DUF1259 domain-containing protein [Marininema halotolerans]SFS61250.1 protein of unknown function [Marininema halotolerans]
MVQIHAPFEKQCNAFSRIFGGTRFVNPNLSCESVGNRRFPVQIQGVRTNSLNAKFMTITFQDRPSEVRNHLCLGVLHLLQRELTPVIRELSKFPSIIIASAFPYFLNVKPLLVSLHIESFDDPVVFAANVKTALNAAKVGLAPTSISAGSPSCKLISRVISPKAMPFKVNGLCEPIVFRNRFPRILGLTNYALVDFEFSITPIRNSQKALCLARLWVYQDELNRVVARIKQQGLRLGNASQNFTFSHPRSYFVTYQSIANPLAFALKSSKVIQGLQ